MGCGTGEFIWRFLKDGFSVIGVDLSEKMLEISEKKLKEKNLKNNNYSLINENIINYENKKNKKNNKSEINQVDYIICNFDTVNYLKNEKEFLKFIEKCNRNLKKGGYLIFDAVTEDIFEEIFENDIFLDEELEYTSIWRHEKLGKRKHLVEIDLFIRENKNDNLFRKYNEVQNKFIYEPEWIVETVQNKGFEIFDTASNPEFGESRIFFVLKKL
ncbi:class I SAM-dependent methyltransferase [Leptotrichia buccalis]|uniref:class I SAM-dependent methyltransferase n=1 Tax=Leptotrichia buccalis TaxID=40542 RepID=UPI001EEF7BE7|nr:class I SAM-dependent methyltransferase [Leptotrichia buccalis]